MKSRENKRKAPLTTIEMDENGALIYKENLEASDAFTLHANSAINVNLVNIDNIEIVDGSNLPSLFEDKERERASILLDKRIISIYQKISEMRDVARVNVKDFFVSFINTLLNDVKLAHRTFRLKVNCEGELDLYIDHIVAINVATISVLNELNEENAIQINLEVLKRGMVLEFEMETEEQDNLYFKEAIMDKYPRLATRLSYIDCLCNEDGNGFELSVINGKAKLTYEIMEAKSAKGALHQAPFGQLNESLLLELLSVFFS
ncbi:MAG: hypothetical protein IJ309_05855 [Clostridia bacterium]|nr:hypothetical protein [Clostridia bacterium]